MPKAKSVLAYYDMGAKYPRDKADNLKEGILEDIMCMVAEVVEEFAKEQSKKD